MRNKTIILAAALLAGAYTFGAVASTYASDPTACGGGQKTEKKDDKKDKRS
jgi:Spy/CpxP family protein refolding chaperone